MSKLPHVTWLRTFESAARNRSFSAAAGELGLTPAAVSQQIKLLEHHLGVQLFTRLPRGVALTDIGHAYAQPVRRSFTEIEAATTSLFGANRRQTVRVHASISYGALVLAPQLPAFHATHPDISVELTTAVWTDRIKDRATDVEIRFGYGDWDERDIRHLGHRSAELVCPPAVAAALGPDLSIRALAGQAVQIIGSEADWDQLAALDGVDLPPVVGAMKADSSLIALQVLSGGHGAAILCEDFSRRSVAAGHLVSPFAVRLPLARSFFLVVQDRARERPEVAQFCDWLVARETARAG